MTRREVSDLDIMQWEYQPSSPKIWTLFKFDLLTQPALFAYLEQYLVSEEAREWLRRIKEPVGVICVAGKYRTGKSFLLNRVIINTRDKKGFGVGPTIQPCTKGLWCWTELLETTHQG